MLFILPIFYCCLLSLLSGPIGSLILWSRLTFFGETIAHASILGLFLSYTLGIPLTIAMSIIVIFYCIMLEVLLDETKDQAQILPIFSYGVLGIGFILIETYLPSTAALFNVLLGDLLLVTKNDLLSLSAMVVLVWFLWLRYQKEVLLSILIPDLAILRKIQIRKMNLIKNIITGLAISFVIQAAGMLLSMALLTIPPLTAKMACKSPQQMVITTCAISFISMSLGFYFGLRFDVSLGATMSCCCLLVFVTVKVALLLQQKIRLKSSA